MNKPIVKIIDSQKETLTNSDLNQTEVEQLLQKYGYKSPEPKNVVQKDDGLTFDDLCRIKENEENRKREELSRRINGPKAITFDNRNVNYSETRYSNMEVDNGKLNLKIEIVTDMKF